MTTTMKKIKGFLTMNRGGAKKKERPGLDLNKSGSGRSGNTLAPEPAQDNSNKFRTMPTRSLNAASPSHENIPHTTTTTSTVDSVPQTEIDFLTTYEKQIIEEINTLRTNPSSYLAHLESRKQYYDMSQKTLAVPGFPAVLIEEGLPAVTEAINFLNTQKPVQPLTPSRGMCLASRDHVNDIGVTGATSHTGSDGSDVRARLNRHAAGHWIKSGGLMTAQQIGFSITDSDSPPDVNVGKEIICQILIEDGSPKRSNRVTLMNPDLRFLGVGYGKHSQYDSMYVLIFANKYDEKGTRPPEEKTAPTRDPSAHAANEGLSPMLNTGKPAATAPTDSNVCGVCQQPLGLRRIVVEGRKLHPECFSCNKCHKKLEGGTFYSQDDKLYCEDDFWTLFGAKCEQCGKIIKGGRVEANGKVWHPACFPDMAL
eukprot:TRINITY_DN16110_c0_g1_i1.p1 TRINITY_DN16110_c0_g1~~TRINITY_DN16110_c0_g1_i1.p1  ORF type:complete len:425 (+),score=62.23 TRINITY_DN16110_c0_g1_i1:73-1347(+)